ncbi:unnamed protein product [Ilex paraguariensis]|uniref:DUF506 family protein n=1 Tax=Ilex paraguariensis TaxID=185542 RepID=A0ABC8T1V2_9AQUA
MAKNLVRFKRITAAFDDVARARLCESSGSEHSAAAEDSVADLSDLVDSFLEREGRDAGGGEEERERSEREEGQEEERRGRCEDEETKELVRGLVDGYEGEEDGGGLTVKRLVCEEVEMALRSLGTDSLSSEVKRGVMSWLRHRGFNAGLCKSRWEKSAGHPAGKYEYIDILISKTRYIIEVSLSKEFTIARPTLNYASLLQLFPQVCMFNEGELKQVVRLMCAAMRESLKKSDLHAPPWRRNGYVQAKWFGPYKRMTNTEELEPAKSLYGVEMVAGGSVVGFETSMALHGGCRGEVVGKGGLHVGNLRAVFNGMPW